MIVRVFPVALLVTARLSMAPPQFASATRLKVTLDGLRSVRFSELGSLPSAALALLQNQLDEEPLVEDQSSFRPEDVA